MGLLQNPEHKLNSFFCLGNQPVGPPKGCQVPDCLLIFLAASSFFLRIQKITGNLLQDILKPFLRMFHVIDDVLLLVPVVLEKVQNQGNKQANHDQGQLIKYGVG